MDNLQNYDQFVNEGALGDFKDKILKFVKSFQNKETFLRKLYNFAAYGTVPLSIAYIYVIGIQVWPEYFCGADFKEFLKTHRFIQWGLYTLWFLSLQSSWFKMSRRKVIMNKIRKVRQELDNNEFRSFVCAVIGDKRNINAAINKLKNDGVIDDNHLLQTEDITIVDFSGTFKDVKKEKEERRDIDPYGEENWNVEGDDLDNNVKFFRMRRLARNLEAEFKVRFRSIEDEYDIEDTNMLSHDKKYKDARRADYNRNLEEFRRGDPIQMPHMNQQIDQPEDDEGGEGEEMQIDDFDEIVDYAVRDIDDEPQENWIQQKREEGDVEDLEDGRVNVKVKMPRKRFKDKFKDFVVPGFDIKPPEIEQR